MTITFNYRNLKISEDECLQVLDQNNTTTQEYELMPSRDGNYRIMAVGYTKNAKLCEVGIEFFEENVAVAHMHIFHGMKATKTFRDLYGKSK